MSSPKKSKSPSSRKSPGSPMSAPNTSALLLASNNPNYGSVAEFVVPSPMGTPEAVVVNSVDGPIVVEASSAASGAPNVMSLLRAPVEGLPGSYSQSNARQRRLAMWRAREPVRVNISPRARWSSSSEGRRRRTKRFPAARMRGLPRGPPGRGMIPMLPPPFQGRMRERGLTRRNIPAMYLPQYQEARDHIQRLLDDSAIYSSSSSFSSRSPSPATRYGHSSRSRSPRRLMVRINREGPATRYGVPRIAPPPAGPRRTLRRDRQFRFQDDDDDRRHRREWRKTKKQLKRMIGHRIPKGASSSSSSSSSSN